MWGGLSEEVAPQLTLRGQTDPIMPVWGCGQEGVPAGRVPGPDRKWGSRTARRGTEWEEERS